MGVQEVVLILMVVFSFCSPASLASVSKNLVSDNKNMGKKGIGEDSISINGGGNGLVNQSKFAHGAAGAGGSRSHGGEGDNGNGGQSQGGAAVIPVYSGGAAAAAQRNHHRAAGTCTRCFKGGLPVLFASTLVSLLLHISV